MRTRQVTRASFRLLPLIAMLCLWPGPRQAVASPDEPAEPGMDGGGGEPGMDGGVAPGKDGGDAQPPGEGLDDTDDTAVSIKDKIDTALKKGVMFLRSKQNGEGSWGRLAPGPTYSGGGEPYLHPAGLTALALYALLKCGVPANDPQVKKGFAWLDKNHRRPAGSYETSVLLLAVTATADPSKKTAVSEQNKDKIRARLTGPMRKWAQELVDSLVRKHEGRQGWRYQVTEGTGKSGNTEHRGSEDMSSTQLAALGLFAADRCGVSVPKELWVSVLKFAMAQQEDDGPEVERTVVSRKTAPPAPGGGAPDRYGPEKPPAGPVKDRARGFAYMKSSADERENSAYGSMTGAGLSTIMIARHVLEMRKDASWKKGGFEAKVQTAIYDALAWIALNWSPFENPGRPNSYHIYWLYGVERGCDLVGNRLIGKHFWYLEGATQIVNRQKPNGAWDTGSTHGPDALIDTPFALLFLKRSVKGAIPFPDVTGGSDDEPVDNRGK